MRYAIPAVLILLVGIAAGLHRRTLPSKAGQRLVQGASYLVESAEAKTVPMSQEFSAQPPVDPIAHPKQSHESSTLRSASPQSWRKMCVLLDRELVVTTVQRISAEQILKDREAEIVSCHEAILRSGVIDIRHYEWQVGLMKESWYRKIDALLDRAQHARFVALVQQGFFNEGLAFTVEPGMTVLD